MAATMDGEQQQQRMSICKTTRSFKKRRNSIYNALRSIYEDPIFVSEIAALWPDPTSSPTSGAASGTPPASSPPAISSPRTATPTTAPSAPSASTPISPSSPRGGCIIVDSTRKGKRFPDSMSKAIPIWACVLSRAIARRLERRRWENRSDGELEVKSFSNKIEEMGHISDFWDCSLHLPVWVLNTEKAFIEDRLEEWTEQLEACGADIDTIPSSLRKPLRPLWISPRTLIWLNEVPDHNSWDFTPIILV